MDDSTVVSLTAALAASPENRELRMLLVRAHLDRDAPEAADAPPSSRCAARCRSSPTTPTRTRCSRSACSTPGAPTPPSTRPGWRWPSSRNRRPRSTPRRWRRWRGDLAKAESWARAVLEVEPERLDALVLMGHVLLRRGDVEAAYEHAGWALRNDPADRGALRLMAAIKARRSPLLGLWWRYSTWMGGLGDGRAIVVLLLAYVAYRVALVAAEDGGSRYVATLVEGAWLGIVAYTWFGHLFQRALRRELQGIELERSF